MTDFFNGITMPFFLIDRTILLIFRGAALTAISNPSLEMVAVQKHWIPLSFLMKGLMNFSTGRGCFPLDVISSRSETMYKGDANVGLISPKYCSLFFDASF